MEGFLKLIIVLLVILTLTFIAWSWATKTTYFHNVIRDRDVKDAIIKKLKDKKTKKDKEK